MTLLKKALSIIFFISLMIPATQAFELKVPVSSFASSGLKGCSVINFNGSTKYRIVQEENSSRLRAFASSSASACYKELRVDLEKTPWIKWSWKIEKTFGDIAEQKKDGDDFPARLFVIADDGKSMWKNPVLNYIWANNTPPGTHWPSAYGSNIIMIPVVYGSRNAGQWVTHHRNVKEDFKKLFGLDCRYVKLVALMTDTDSTGLSTTTYYGDIYFSSDAPESK